MKIAQALERIGNLQQGAIAVVPQSAKHFFGC